jgi:hypothetical protein
MNNWTNFWYWYSPLPLKNRVSLFPANLAKLEILIFPAISKAKMIFQFLKFVSWQLFSLNHTILKKSCLQIWFLFLWCLGWIDKIFAIDVFFLVIIWFYFIFIIIILINVSRMISKSVVYLSFLFYCIGFY